MTSAADYQAKVDDSVVNMDRLDLLVNSTGMVETDAGSVPSLPKLLADGQTVIDAAQSASGDGIAAIGAASTAALTGIGETAAVAQAALLESYENDVAAIDATADARIVDIINEGDTQVARVETAGDDAVADVDDAAAATMQPDIAAGLLAVANLGFFKIRDVAGKRIVTIRRDDAAPGGYVEWTDSPTSAAISALGGAVNIQALTEEQGGGFAIVDQTGKIAFRIDSAGLSTFFKLVLPASAKVSDDIASTLASRLLPGGMGARFSYIPDEADYALAIVDQNGKVGFGIHLSARPFTGFGAAEEAIPPTPRAVFAAGDSLTHGNLAPVGTIWPSLLAAATGRIVTNFGLNANTMTQIAARIGSTPALLTISGNQIPASGAVSVTSISVGLLPAGLDGPTSMAGIFWGVPCVLSSTDGVAYTLTRTTAGQAIPVLANTPFLPSIPMAHQRDFWTIFGGRNDASAGTNLLTVTAPLVDDVVRWLGHERYLVFGITTVSNGTENKGSSGYNAIVEYNNRQQTRYGSRFFDIRRYLIDTALTDMGLTATTADNTAISNDVIPPVFLDGDFTHFSDLGEVAIAAEARRRILQQES